MAWFEFHAKVLRHRKTLRLASRLDVTRAHAAGILACIWGECIDQAEDGDLSDLEPAELEYWTDYPDGARLLDALIETRWLDRDGDAVVVHDWYDYAGKYAEKRRADAERKRKSRVQRTSAGRPRDGAGTHPPTHSTHSTNPPTTARARTRARETTLVDGALEYQSGKSGVSQRDGKSGKAKRPWKCLARLAASDLADASRLEEIAQQGQREGVLSGSEADRVFVFAAAARATREGANPPALFRSLCQERGPITHEDEDAGLRMMKRAQGQDVREPKKKTGGYSATQ